MFKRQLNCYFYWDGKFLFSCVLMFVASADEDGTRNISFCGYYLAFFKDVLMNCQKKMADDISKQGENYSRIEENYCFVFC